jgi:hypothetical protein
MFASYSRLDLNLVVGPEKPSCIKATLRSCLPILIDYSTRSNGPPGPPRKITASALWRMRAALGHRDRVREISFGGWDVDFITTFIRATNHHFPALDSLNLGFPAGQEPVIPATFLRGPGQSDLCLRRLRYGGSLPSVSGLLMSATALTDLILNVPSNCTPLRVGPSQESILLASLQGMQCLRSLDLTTPYYLPGSESLHPTLKDIVPLSKLTHFRYSSPTKFLNNFMSRLSTPSLQDANFKLYTGSPVLYLSRVIDELREGFRSLSVYFGRGSFRLLFSTQSGKTDHFKPSFSLNVNYFPYSVSSINSTPSTKLALVEELALISLIRRQYGRIVFRYANFFASFTASGCSGLVHLHSCSRLDLNSSKMTERLSCPCWKKSSYQTRSTGAMQRKQRLLSSHSPPRAREPVAL